MMTSYLVMCQPAAAEVQATVQIIRIIGISYRNDDDDAGR